MISGLLLLWIFHEGWKPRYSLVSLTLIGLVSLVTPFILNPVGPVNSYLGKEQIGRGLILDSASVSVRQELSKGKDLVAFLSLTCSHCRIAGYKLHILKEKNPSWPIFMILNGDKEDLKKFYRETYTENVPYEMMTVKQGFMSNSGPAVPAIFLTEEGVIKQRINYLNLSEDSLALWFDKLNQGAP